VTVRRPSSWRRAKQRTRLGRRSSRATGRVRVRIDPHYFGPTEVDRLIAVPSKTWRKLDWRHRVSFDNLGDEDIARMREAKVPLKCMIEPMCDFIPDYFAPLCRKIGSEAVYL